MSKTGPHIERRLSSSFVRSAPPGRHTDGGGLYLVVDPSGAKRWLLRLTLKKRRRDFGLGSARVVSLSQARSKALVYRQLVADGKNPTLEAQFEKRSTVSFEELAERVFQEYIKPTIKNPKAKQQWINTLRTYAYPELGKLPVDEISRRHIKAVLDKIWLNKRETAERVRQRLRVCFDVAVDLEYRPESLPNPVQGLKMQGPKKKVKSFEALDYKVDFLSFYREISQIEDVGSLALRFCILTAVRSSNIRFMTWPEVGGRELFIELPWVLSEYTWKIPAQRMKMDEEFHIPLSMQACEILHIQAQKENKHSELVFPSPYRPKNPLSDNTMRKFVQSRYEGKTVHGFRSTFRTWAEENSPPDITFEVMEAALAHTKKDKVSAAYLRTQYIEKRRHLMNVWGLYCVEGQNWELLEEMLQKEYDDEMKNVDL
jgi:integrase